MKKLNNKNYYKIMNATDLKNLEMNILNLKMKSNNMEDDLINIAEILTSYPKSTKLYSPICGECELDCICYGGDAITVVYGGKDNSNYRVLCFDRYGRYETTGEVMLFPSKNCRDWDAMRVTTGFNKEEFDSEKDYTDIIDYAIQFLEWVKRDTDKDMWLKMIYDVYNTDNKVTLEELVQEYFECNCSNPDQWDNAFKGVTKAVYYIGANNLSDIENNINNF